MTASKDHVDEDLERGKTVKVGDSKITAKDGGYTVTTPIDKVSFEQLAMLPDVEAAKALIQIVDAKFPENPTEHYATHFAELARRVVAGDGAKALDILDDVAFGQLVFTAITAHKKEKLSAADYAKLAVISNKLSKGEIQPKESIELAKAL